MSASFGQYVMKNDSELNKLLQSWRVSPPVESHFRHSVWDRISLQDDGPMRRFLNACKDWCLVSLPKPAYAAGLLLLFALSGAAIAGVSSQKVRQEQQTEMQNRYVASIDPVAMADKLTSPRP